MDPSTFQDQIAKTERRFEQRTPDRECIREGLERSAPRAVVATKIAFELGVS